MYFIYKLHCTAYYVHYIHVDIRIHDRYTSRASDTSAHWNLMQENVQMYTYVCGIRAYTKWRADEMKLHYMPIKWLHNKIAYDYLRRTHPDKKYLYVMLLLCKMLLGALINLFAQLKKPLCNCERKNCYSP